MEKPVGDKESDILCGMVRHESGDIPKARRCVYAVPRAEIAYFHSILEGYDDLAVMRTIRPLLGHVEVYISPGREEEFTGLMEALIAEGVALSPVTPREEAACES